MMKVFYCSEFAVDSDLETVSKSRIIAQFVAEGRVPGAILASPSPVTRGELLLIHDAGYVEGILSGAIGRLAAGPWTPELLNSILFAAGGMRDAVLEALQSGRAGCLASGQHHANRQRGFALCTVNGLALAALVALNHVSSVGVLDLDAHFGGGTFSILKENPRVHLADVGVSNLDDWTPIDPARHHCSEVKRASNYLAAVRKALKRMQHVDFLIYYAGMDPHESAGGIPGITTEMLAKRDQMVASFCTERKKPVIFAPAGGYTVPLSLEEVAELHLETIKAFVEY